MNLSRVLIKIRNTYSIDLRALSLMRIGLSLVVIVDLLIRWSDLEAHYTDAGIWPTDLLKNFGWQDGFWSFHVLSGNKIYTTIIFSIHFIIACLVLIGYKTRIATLLLWLFTISLHNRNLFVLQSGDDLLRVALFWTVFLPWNSYFSFDARKSNIKQREPFFNVAIFGFIILICSVYVFTVLFKNSAEWRTDFTAIYYALSLEQIRLPLGDWLYQFPQGMKVLTAMAYWIEILIPILILLPFRKKQTYFLAFIFIVLLHLSIGLTMEVGMFHWIDISTALIFIPGKAFDKIGLRIRTFGIGYKKRKNHLLNFLKNAFLSFCIIICIVHNLSGFNWFKYELDDSFQVVVNGLRLNQYWGMFSPTIMKEDGWYIYEGFDKDGKHWDLKYNNPIIIVDKPEHIVNDYKNDRWRKLAENVQRIDYTFLRPLVCKYYLRKWNKEHPEKQMASLRLLFMEESSLENYQTKPIEKKEFCFCITEP